MNSIWLIVVNNMPVQAYSNKQIALENLREWEEVNELSVICMEVPLAQKNLMK